MKIVMKETVSSINMHNRYHLRLGEKTHKITIYIVKVRVILKQENTSCTAASSGGWPVQRNGMPFFFSFFCTRSAFTKLIHLLFCSLFFSALHKGIHALINPLSVPQKMISFAVKMLVILLPADSLPTFCCFSLNHI